jgi:hypothetical protein
MTSDLKEQLEEKQEKKQERGKVTGCQRWPNKQWNL